MKAKFTIIIFLWMYQTGATQNLVPNGDFEQVINCPSNVGQLDSTLFWFTPTLGTADYFNVCSSQTVAGVPVNFAGYQMPNSGNAYTGIYLSGVQYREYIEVLLTSPLIANTCYHLEYAVNLGDISRYTTDAIGAFFSDTIVDSIANTDPLLFTPQVTNPSGVYPDTIGWIIVSGNFTAVGGEKYLIIGNFKPVANTNVVVANSSGALVGVYAYVDNVCLTTCNSSCLTSINEPYNPVEVKVFPNPATSGITISSSAAITQLKITNTLGQLCIDPLTLEKGVESIQVSVKDLKAGIYFVSITIGNKVVTKKVLLK